MSGEVDAAVAAIPAVGALYASTTTLLSLRASVRRVPGSRLPATLRLATGCEVQTPPKSHLSPAKHA
eukprot:6208240-Pleurochrysis_carterae.AAC.2